MAKDLIEYSHVYFYHPPKDKERKKKWQYIALSEIDACAEKCKNSDVFCTAQRFSDSEPAKKDGKIEKVSHLCDIYFDFDSKDLTQAQADVKKLIDFFCKGHDVPASLCRVYYSGKKGFHVFLDYRIFDIEPDVDLTYIIKSLTTSLSKQLDLKTFDESVYSYPRQMRLNNSQHSKTELHKIELSHDELDKSIDEIKELAKAKREQIFDESEYEDVEPIPSLAALYKKHHERFKLHQQLTANKEPVLIKTKELAACVRDLLDNHIKQEGTRNYATMFLSCYFKDSGISEQAAIDALLPWALRTPKNLTSTHNESELKNSTLSCVKSVFENKNYHFYCPTMRKLGAACVYNKCAALKNKAEFNAVLKVFEDNYVINDTDPIRVVFATVIANLFEEADPVWLFVIAPPSYLKTECITSLNDTPFTYPLSSLTAQTFASGMKNAPNASLLKKLKKMGVKILALKDFTSILSIRQESRAEILAQLREIYDGAYSKSFGTGEEIKWTGKLGLIAGVTTVIDIHYSIYQTMGERFIQYRIDGADEMQIATKSIDNIGKDSDIRAKIRSATASYFDKLQIPPISKIERSDALIEKIAKLACFIVKARSGVIRDHRGIIEYIPDAEGPARLAKQLATLACALAVLNNRSEINEADYALLCKIGWHCLPKQRASVLKILNAASSALKTAEVGVALNYPTTTARMFLEDLHGLSVIDKHIEKQKATEEGARDKLIYSWQVNSRYWDIVAHLVKATLSAKEKEAEEAVEEADKETETSCETSEGDIF